VQPGPNMIFSDILLGVGLNELWDLFWCYSISGCGKLFGVLVRWGSILVLANVMYVL